MKVYNYQREFAARRWHKYAICCAVGLMSLMTSCSHEKEKSSESEETTKHSERKQEAEKPEEVSVLTLKPCEFAYNIVSNGVVTAAQYVDKYFTASGAVVEHIYVKNGQYVSRGQILATLDRFKLENTVATARNTLERAKLDLADALIGQGYNPEDMSEIPDEIMRLARVRSGVIQYETQLREAERALEEATLRAPFDGIVANLFQKEGNFPDGSKPFCRIIASKTMAVTFSILESELSIVSVGEDVEVKPFSADKTYFGRISSINPIIDNDGMVKVEADINGGTGLYVGMNVRVIVKKKVEEALVVPKSAVVLRSGGRPVVFTYENGNAMWNYVTTGLENMNEYVITEGLKEGQEVIVSGNLNLAHEAPVKVIKD